MNLSDNTEMFQEINGAVYFPASVYNVDQSWAEYDPVMTSRDFGYAERIHLNALRVFGSYYAYQQDPDLYQRNIRDMLEKAAAKGLKILFVIFEDCGLEPTDALRWSKDPLTAVAIKSPGSAVTGNPANWQPCKEHVKWFMDNFKNDQRLLGIEVINEPSADTKPFAHAVLAVAVSNKGTVPLTIGTIPEQVLEYVPDGVDVLQLHNNFPAELTESEKIIRENLQKASSVKLPLWMTEWQRTRPSGGYWDGTSVPEAERFTDLKSLAGQVKSYRTQMGAFFWSLMIKPAYLPGQRKAGTLNGLFWEDGRVWDLAGARIIADNPQLPLIEYTKIPF